jgi:hypothetical protein
VKHVTCFARGHPHQVNGPRSNGNVGIDAIPVFTGSTDAPLAFQFGLS